MAWSRSGAIRTPAGSAARGAPQVVYNTDAQGVALDATQFALCKRDGVAPCAKAGEVCGPTSNYTWNKSGYCQGSCKSSSEVCTSYDKCCNGTCTPKTSQCAFAQNLTREAQSLGQQINAVSGSVHQVSASINQLAHIHF